MSSTYKKPGHVLKFVFNRSNYFIVYLLFFILVAESVPISAKTTTVSFQLSCRKKKYYSVSIGFKTSVTGEITGLCNLSGWQAQFVAPLFQSLGTYCIWQTISGNRAKSTLVSNCLFISNFSQATKSNCFYRFSLWLGYSKTKQGFPSILRGRTVFYLITCHLSGLRQMFGPTLGHLARIDDRL